MSLLQNIPNPFNSTTTISFTLPPGNGTSERGHEGTSDGTPSAIRVTLKVYNILGQEICMLMDDVLESGTCSVVWNGCNDSGDDVPSGVYFYRLSAGTDDQTETGRMILLR
jgi:flagellar hook assembly protein FlgD